jgi:hypothetical protein
LGLPAPLAGTCGDGGASPMRPIARSNRAQASGCNSISAGVGLGDGLVLGAGMSQYQLPDALLLEIGRAATNWGSLELQVKLATSALASKATDGWPDDHLEMSFKQLREMWFALAAEHAGIDAAALKVANDSLAALSKDRGVMLHGLWTHIEGERYRVTHWVQRKPKDAKDKAPESRVAIHSQEVTLATLREFADAVESEARAFVEMHT